MKSKRSIKFDVANLTIVALLFMMVFIGSAETAAAQDCCEPAPSGIIGWWSGNYNALDFVDAHNGTLWGNAGFTDGLVGGAFSFDGESAGVLIASTGCYCCIEDGFTNVQDSFTIEFWAKPLGERNSTPETTSGIFGIGGQRYAVFPAWGGSTGLAGAGVSIGTNGISVFEHSDNYLASVLVWDASLTDWTHVAIVYENRQPKLFVNGVLVKTGLTGGRYVFPSTELGSGKGYWWYGTYQGLLDEVTVYDRILSANEIAAIYTAGSAGKCTVTTVAIDIKPGSVPNSINLRSSGVVPVAILSNATFDATQVNPATVSLAGATVKLIGKGDKYSCHVEDVNGDGLLDLVCQVLAAQFHIEPGTSTAVLEAETFSSQKIMGQDTIQIVP
jgi:hypothetical protein